MLACFALFEVKIDQLSQLHPSRHVSPHLAKATYAFCPLFSAKKRITDTLYGLQYLLATSLKNVRALQKRYFSVRGKGLWTTVSCKGRLWHPEGISKIPWLFKLLGFQILTNDKNRREFHSLKKLSCIQLIRSPYYSQSDFTPKRQAAAISYSWPSFIASAS